MQHEESQRVSVGVGQLLDGLVQDGGAVVFVGEFCDTQEGKLQTGSEAGFSHASVNVMTENQTVFHLSVFTVEIKNGSHGGNVFNTFT